MIFNSPEHRLPNVPWVAVVGEFTTTACFGCLGLFVSFANWKSWPEMLLGWHFALIVMGAITIALALIRRRSGSLKVAIVLGAYIGLPSLLTLSQTMDQIGAAADGPTIQVLATCTVWGLGMLGQVAVVFSCLGRLSPIQKMAADHTAATPQL